MKKKFVSELATQVAFPGDGYTSDTEKWGILQFRVESHRISPSWLRLWEGLLNSGGITAEARTFLFMTLSASSGMDEQLVFYSSHRARKIN